nr:hypothetical protein [Mammaliicoccus sp. Marseille-Q6498]
MFQQQSYSSTYTALFKYGINIVLTTLMIYYLTECNLEVFLIDIIQQNSLKSIST